MSKGPKTTTTQQNTYAWQTPGDTGDIKAWRDQQYEVDPGIGQQFALAQEQMNNNYDNPLGGYTTNDVRMKQKAASINGLNQQRSAAHRQGQYDVNMLKAGQKAGLAGLTAPQLVQTGGTGTSQQSGGLGQAIIGAGANVASAALM